MSSLPTTNLTRLSQKNGSFKEINSSSVDQVDKDHFPDESEIEKQRSDFPMQTDSPCSIHALIDPNQKKSNFRKNSMRENQNASTLAQTAVAVRTVSKDLCRQRIKWNQPNTVMVLTKPGDKSLGSKARDLVIWLLTSIQIGTVKGLNVYVDEHLEKDKRFDYKAICDQLPTNHNKYLKFWSPGLVLDSPEIFDFVITLGGDGTVLYTSWVFQRVVPAVIPFHLGSLGFLTPFDFAFFKQHIQHSLEEGVRINMRMRFSCTIYRNQGKAPLPLSLGSPNLPVSPLKYQSYDNHRSLLFDTAYIEENRCETPSEKIIGGYQGFVRGDTYEILNDLVVDRGPSPSMSQLELYGDGSYLTTVQADGLALATPTGSTAYSLAAGGSLVHPEIPALLITPICPHSLSFRPMLLPDSTILFICVPFRARGSAWVSFDGRGRVELNRGDFIRVEASKYPFPTVCATGTQSKDWFNSLNRCLLWNQRTLQKSLDSSSEQESDTDKTEEI